ncbi:MAG: MFS transporter [Pseudomonadota bacterium]
MLTVLRQSWALLFGVMLLMLGNGIQGTLLGIRGGLEGFSTQQMSYVMSAYFIGFLFGSRLVPGMLRRVGHVRVFAALGSMISAVLVLYPVLPDWTAWALMRVAIGFSFSGVYITAESWLNNASTNETRGQALSLYMIMQMVGIIGSQVFLNFGDPSGFVLFVVPSVLVSLAFTPILLTVSPAPAFEATRRLSLLTLFKASPLGFVGMFLLGGVFSAQFGMASVWGTLQGLSVRELTIFIAAIYVGGLVFQYPIGWASDRMDRRALILALAGVGAVVTLGVAAIDAPFWLLVLVGMETGAISNPLYSLIIAYVNDYLGKDDMAAASAGLLFVNGVGAIAGPIVTGWLMGRIGPPGFFVFMGGLFALLALYAGWRMTRRAAAPAGAYVPVSPNATPVAVEAAYDPSATGAVTERD